METSKLFLSAQRDCDKNSGTIGISKLNSHLLSIKFTLELEINGMTASYF